jgi:hypothetical protein
MISDPLTVGDEVEYVVVLGIDERWNELIGGRPEGDIILCGAS